jgi:hypothetical protein
MMKTNIIYLRLLLLLKLWSLTFGDVYLMSKIDTRAINPETNVTPTTMPIINGVISVIKTQIKNKIIRFSIFFVTFLAKKASLI